ncbi:MAG: hypothetical protein M1816_008100 [Peltula sp. TS41687]|nr:MAG: hypothetical protein M1816_008100 [Peltula sp. TS41687]
MRSRTGCLTCRQRKLKCDEQKPVCGPCGRGRRECQPSSGVIFRHQQNASMNGGSRDGDGDGDDDDIMQAENLKRFYAYRDTFDEGNVWVDVPKQIRFVHLSEKQAASADLDMLDGEGVKSARWEHGLPAVVQEVTAPMADQLELPVHDDGQGMTGLRALSVAASVGLPLPLQPELSLTACLPDQDPSSASPAMSQLIEPIGPEQSGLSSLRTSSVDVFGVGPEESVGNAAGSTTAGLLTSIDIDTSTAHDRTHTITLSQELDDDREITFLLRQFSECTGKWMDLFDHSSYFSSCVPVIARTSSLVRYAAVAYAAKQLGRARGSRPAVEPNGPRLRLGGCYPSLDRVNWTYKAAKYNEKAVSLLLDALYEDLTIGLSTGRNPAEHRLGDRRNDLLIGAVILSMVECLDKTSMGPWSTHLNEAKWLIDIGEAGATPSQQHAMTRPISSQGGKIQSKAWKAAFWNLARQDLLYAFIIEGQTRLDTENIQLWRDAGIALDAEGFVQPSNQNGGDPMEEDMIGNAIIWLTSKIVNFIAAADGIYPCQGANISGEDSMVVAPGSPIGVNQKTLLERWREIDKELNTWHDGLPDTFRLSGRLDPSQPLPDSDLSANAYFPEIWYSNPICASTMQFYHMARILLLINKPHESTAGKTTVTNRLNSYRLIEMEKLLFVSIKSSLYSLLANALRGIQNTLPNPSAEKQVLFPFSGSSFQSPTTCRDIRVINIGLGRVTRNNITGLLAVEQFGGDLEVQIPCYSRLVPLDLVAPNGLVEDIITIIMAAMSIIYGDEDDPVDEAMIPEEGQHLILIAEMEPWWLEEEDVFVAAVMKGVVKAALEDHHILTDDRLLTEGGGQPQQNALIPVCSHYTQLLQQGRAQENNKTKCAHRYGRQLKSQIEHFLRLLEGLLTKQEEVELLEKTEMDWEFTGAVLYFPTQDQQASSTCSSC